LLLLNYKSFQIFCIKISRNSNCNKGCCRSNC